VSDIEYLRIELEGLRRELATYRPDPDQTPAPRYPGYAWLGKYSYCGPYHLVAVHSEPYPMDTVMAPRSYDGKPFTLPDIHVPAKKGLCGAEWQTLIIYPTARDACIDCLAKVAKLGVLGTVAIESTQPVLSAEEDS
jgi:hypothetical protein